MNVSSYQQLVTSAARLDEVDSLSEWVEAGDAAAVIAWLERNQPALSAARRALSPACAVAVRFEAAFFEEHCHDLSQVRKLTIALRAEACLAVARNDLHAAAVIGLELLELANAVRRGGLVVDLQFGLAASNIGLETLRRIRASLDSSTRGLVVGALQRLDAEREPFAEVVARDRRWEVETGYSDEADNGEVKLSDDDGHGLPDEQEQMVLGLIQSMRELPQSEHHQMQRAQDNRGLALLRMLAIDLSLRDVYDATGALPADLAPLSTSLSKSALVDPFTGQPFRYRRTGDATFFLSGAISGLHPALVKVRRVLGRPADTAAEAGELSLDDDCAAGEA